MAQIQFQNLIAPVAIGAISAAGELVEMNRKATSPGEDSIFNNAGLIADLVGGGYGIVNHMMDLGFPRSGAVEGLGAGVAVLTRRVTHMVGSNVLGLNPGTPTKESPGRHISSPRANGRLNAYSPSVAVEVDPRSRKRQFFSVT